MTTRQKFDVLRTEIGEGTMLIEASAGTGKTFTIAFLVLRLLLERPDLTIDRILVTTFTELATAELRSRIRERLREALAVFEGAATDDELLLSLHQTYRSDPAAAGRLEAALVNFDEAPIYTIHGFCQRVLADRAFESGTLFDAELLTNERELLREIVHDFWRLRFYIGERLPALLALRGKITPKQFFKDIEELTKNPAVVIRPARFRAYSEIAADIEHALAALRDAWVSEKASICELFRNPLWAKGDHEDVAYMGLMLEHLEQCCAEKSESLEQFESIEQFATSAVHKNTRVAAKKPEHRVFDCCEQITALTAELRAALRAEFFGYAREQLRERKLTRNVISYEDLLTRLEEALNAQGGDELAASIRGRYQAALIDEFQDTDPIQYSIFSRIYRGSSAPVAFIGDPKQAIYAFRGADVFTYMNAARETARKFTLATNWRSETRLVNAVNTIFSRHADPFLLDEISFQPVSPSPHADDESLLIGGAQEPPFQLWTSSEREDPAEHVASEIVRLLASDVVIGTTKLEPRHIAVLASTNAQAASVQEALRARRVPSVLYSSANIFSSREAQELRNVLAAVVQPGQERLVRAALCTDALGLSGNDLDELSRDDLRWESELLRFQQHHEVWRDRGFIQMLHQVAASHGVRQRLLGYPDGERRLTNFLHLAELLHTACVEQRLGMNGLLKWLGQQLQGTAFADREENELRLESDDKAVRIITVHKSKGLEFDVVFCPFAWWNAQPRPMFHDPDEDWRLTLDLADRDAHKELREREALAENLRQFYVAVTRARHRCTVVWRARDKPEKSACARLLGGGKQPEIAAGADIIVSPLPEPSESSYTAGPEKPPAMEPRVFRGEIDRSWGVASFSRLISGREADPFDESLVADNPTLVDESAAVEGIHAFPRGMRAGTCLHEIIELIDFARLTSAEDIIQRKLRGYGIDGFDDVVLENVQKLAALPLADFTLAETEPTSRLSELEFSFPINEFSTTKLAQVLGIDRLQFPQISGFMNGFIDLVVEHGERFYLIDWKSNWLGSNLAAYSRAAVEAEMHRHFYNLQLALYTVALHRYLRVRKQDYDYDRHFGGAFYIFLRGIDPADPTNGVYQQRLDRTRVAALDAVFDK
jgi:exodeoxyribonuclease V beta subunit